jgi:hypothetical protein
MKTTSKTRTMRPSVNHKPLDQRCPHDGGTCHHRCPNTCWRKAHCEPLTSPWPGFPTQGDVPIQGAGVVSPSKA